VATTATDQAHHGVCRHPRKLGRHDAGGKPILVVAALLVRVEFLTHVRVGISTPATRQGTIINDFKGWDCGAVLAVKPLGADCAFDDT
jgi:hypothetical protein